MAPVAIPVPTLMYWPTVCISMDVRAGVTPHY